MQSNDYCLVLNPPVNRVLGLISKISEKRKLVLWPRVKQEAAFLILRDKK